MLVLSQDSAAWKPTVMKLDVTLLLSVKRARIRGHHLLDDRRA